MIWSSVVTASQELQRAEHFGESPPFFSIGRQR